jgi:HEPN domain-containing protein
MAVSKNSVALAKSFIKKAKGDLKSATDLLKCKDFADSTYHSQQSAEKCVKALLILENRFVKDHIVSGIFTRTIATFKNDKEKLEFLVADLKDLEKHWVRSRYPVLSKGLVWDPTEGYTKEIAREALKKASRINRNLIRFIKEKYGITI